MTGTEGELPKYKYKYAVPVAILNSLPNTGKIGGKKNDSTDKDDSHTRLAGNGQCTRVKTGRHIHTRLGNKSLLRKPITNTLIQGNYVVQGSLLANSDLLTSSINQGMPSA